MNTLGCASERLLGETDLYADCDFEVGNQEKELIQANRTILAMRSPVFETMFLDTMVPQPQPIILPDMQPTTFKDFLYYVYTGMADNLRSLDQVVNLSYAASKYMVQDLFKICVRYIAFSLYPENVFQVLEFAILHNEEPLKEECLKMLSGQTRRSLIRSSAYFEDIDESILLSMVQMEIMDITEAELFDAVKHWAGRQCLKKGLEITGINMRQFIDKTIISYIRFLAMTAKEFAESPIRSGILSNDESQAVITNLNRRDHLTMPDQLSISRRRRRANIGYDLGFYTPRLDFNRGIFCLRDVVDEILVQNDGGLDCSVTFSVDRKILIRGIVISSRMIAVREYGALPDYDDCQLLDGNGKILARLYFVVNISSDRTFDVLLNDPILIEENRPYQIRLLLNQNIIHYLLGTASNLNIVNGVCCEFGPPSVRDGIIRGVIFDLV